MIGSAGPALAQQPTHLGGNGDWMAYTFESAGNLVCYMASAPTKQQGDYTRRGDAYALVTHRPNQQTRDVVSIVAGYTYRDSSEVSVKIGSRTFDMFTSGDRAYPAGPAEDKKLVNAMIKGSRMVVEGVSSRGTVTTDTYSLRGFTATRKMIDKACRG